MKKNGFTLIELLAVIIILGILMIIAIPSVTKYISDSRKSAYIDTAKEIISGARNFVNEGSLEMFDTDTSYYIDQACIKTENGSSTPYGKFTNAYVVVNYDGNSYQYYWTSVDDAGVGISGITSLEMLDTELIESDLKDTDIINTLGVNGRHKYMIIDESTNCGKGVPNTVTDYVSGEGESISNRTAAQTIGAVEGLVNIAGAKRYVGGSPKNYVRFNGQEKWRIIGIYGNQLKIVKNDESDYYSYNNNASDRNAWQGSKLETYLNKETEGGYYYSLSQTAKDMITTGTWYVGRINQLPTASEAYEGAKTATYSAKVGLIATYEYLYASDGEGCENVKGNAFSSLCGTTEHNWMVPRYYSWALPVYGSATSDSDYQLVLTQSGDVSGIRVDANGTFRPSVYLKSSVKITGGSGTYVDPYVLE